MKENKHSNYDLAQMQSLPLESKISMTSQRIRSWYEEYDGDVYVSRSGGKDSDVLGHIVKRLYPNVPHVFVNTGLEFDSVRIHATEECDVVVRPEMNFVDVITKYGYPVISKEVANVIDGVKNNKNLKKETVRSMRINGTLLNNEGGKSIYNCEKYKYLLDAPFRISDKCCNVMKKKPAKKYAKKNSSKPIIGTMAQESRLRLKMWIRNGCNGFDMKSPVSNPISFWTEQDILKYIKLYDLKIAEVYGNVIYTDEMGLEYDNDVFNMGMNLELTGVKRTGCVFCMFGITQDTDRFLKLKEIEPKKYDYVMRGGKFDENGMWVPHNGLGYKFVIDWLNENGNLNIKY